MISSNEPWNSASVLKEADYDKKISTAPEKNLIKQALNV